MEWGGGVWQTQPFRRGRAGFGAEMQPVAIPCLFFFFFFKVGLKSQGRERKQIKELAWRLDHQHQWKKRCLLVYGFLSVAYIFYIKSINNPYLTACLQSNIHLCSSPELLQCCRKALWKPMKGRRERGGGGNGTEEHGSSRCETLLTVTPPTRAHLQKPSSAQFCSRHDLEALCSCSNCTCVGLSILRVSDSLASSVWNSFHQIKQQEEEEEEEKAAEGTAEQCLPAWTE